MRPGPRRLGLAVLVLAIVAVAAWRILPGLPEPTMTFDRDIAFIGMLLLAVLGLALTGFDLREWL